MDATQAVVGRLAALAAGDRVPRMPAAFNATYWRRCWRMYCVRPTNACAYSATGATVWKRMIGTTDRRRTAGLDLVVLDYWSGAQRPANTLSGGETFLASLALAFQAGGYRAGPRAGGIRLDTVFIDEGFGTLDGDALNEALRILTDLRAGGRLVGIISHVEELRQRIDTRLEIVKTESGSQAHWVLG